MSDEIGDRPQDSSPKNRRIVIVGATVALVLIAGIGAWFLLSQGDDGSRRDDARTGRGRARGEGQGGNVIPQARWKIRVDPVGIRNIKPTKKEGARVEERGDQIGELLRELYNTLFFRRTQLEKEVRDLFTKKAGHAILRPTFGFPPSATRVRSYRREANIGIEYEKAQEASAKILVSIRSLIGEKTVRVLHKATLWLEREKGRWQVVAFEATQEKIK